jgi:hypothetical protein
MQKAYRPMVQARPDKYQNPISKKTRAKRAGGVESNKYESHMHFKVFYQLQQNS